MNETLTPHRREPHAAQHRMKMIVHLIDGTYELFRQFYGRQRFTGGTPEAYGAAAGVLHDVLKMFEEGATHLAVATDHVIESFRNDLWPGYKTGAGIPGALWAQFHPLEDALAALGVATWPMVEHEADDALASGAAMAARDARVDKVCIWTPDKDLGQCVVDARVVQVHRRSQKILDASGVRQAFGVDPAFIPDFLALVGDSADGYPGIPGIGKVTASRLIARHGAIETFPDSVLGEQQEMALRFKVLATLRTDSPIARTVDELRWSGPTPAFDAAARLLGDGNLIERSRRAAAATSAGASA